MLKLIPNIKLDVVERCAGHGGTFGVMKETHDLANKVGRPTARQIKIGIGKIYFVFGVLISKV